MDSWKVKLEEKLKKDMSHSIMRGSFGGMIQNTARDLYKELENSSSEEEFKEYLNNISKENLHTFYHTSNTLIRIRTNYIFEVINFYKKKLKVTKIRSPLSYFNI